MVNTKALFFDGIAQKKTGCQWALLHRSNKKNWQLLTKFTIRQGFNLLKKNMPQKMRVSNCHEYNKFLQERGNIFYYVNDAIEN
uniref:hypothetical protein n=1 Tax=Wolbachia endosymbiont of Trichogramma kaykai TaxID=444066 RepID=UPI003891A8E2